MKVKNGRLHHMKTVLVRLSYRFIAALADKTHGFPLFSKWKITLGSLLISTSITSCRQKTTCYDISPVEQKNDTIEKVIKHETELPDTVKRSPVTPAKPEAPEALLQVTCYDVVGSSGWDLEPSEPDTFSDPFLDVTCYKIAVVDPEFPGGEQAMWQFVRDNLQFKNNERSVSGLVLVEFLVETDGSLSNIKVFKGFDPYYDAEAVRIVKIMPKWKPGEQSGKFIKTYYQIPIKFELIH